MFQVNHEAYRNGCYMVYINIYNSILEPRESGHREAPFFCPLISFPAYTMETRVHISVSVNMLVKKKPLNNGIHIQWFSYMLYVKLIIFKYLR